MDELWSFVDRQGNKYWVWIAIDAQTREIIGCEIEDRSRASARKLLYYSPYWDSARSIVLKHRLKRFCVHTV
jgi:IS1 family transposase